MAYKLAPISSLNDYTKYRQSYRNIPDIAAQALVHKGGVTTSTYEQDMLKRLCNPRYEYMVLVLIDNEQDKVTSVATGWSYPTKSGTRFHIQNLAVDHEERGKGISSIILDKICNEFLPQNRFTGMEIEVGQQSLKQNLDFYLKAGGIPSETLFSFEAGQAIGEPSFAIKEKQRQAIEQYASKFNDGKQQSKL